MVKALTKPAKRRIVIGHPRDGTLKTFIVSISSYRRIGGDFIQHLFFIASKTIKNKCWIYTKHLVFCRTFGYICS